jgi:hypothetical protein
VHLPERACRDSKKFSTGGYKTRIKADINARLKTLQVTGGMKNE